MEIAFQLWFVKEGGIGSSTFYRSYNMDVDWVHHAKDTVLTTAEVQSIIDKFRSKSLTRQDTMLSTSSPVLSVDPGEINVGSTSGDSSLNIDNIGSGSMKWTASVTIGTSWLSITSGLSGTNSGTINVSYDQNGSSEPRMGSIRITTPGATGSPFCVMVTQQGASASPVISVTPTSHGFGSVEVGSYLDKTFTVENTGYGMLEGNASISAPFTIHSAGSYSLSHGQTQIVTVRFSPTEEGSFNKNVTFTGGGGVTRPVSGEATEIVDAPVIASISDHTIQEGSSYTGPTPTLTAGTQPITYSLITYPNGMVIDPETGVVSWQNPTVAGSPHTITIRATNTAGYDDESWQLTVGPTGVCTYFISPTSEHFSSSGWTGSVSVTTESGCGWGATSNDGWITITSGNSGTGNGTVSYSVSSNSSTGSRTGTMTIAGNTFTVTQEGINIPPTANAGSDHTVEEGGTVTLDGSNSADSDDGIASYLWEQTGGTFVTLSDINVVQPTFIAPNVGSDGESLTFQLTVTDSGGLQSTDSCIVNIIGDNDSPNADAGPDQMVDDGETVTLDGSNSTDPDDGIASYLWTQTAGTPVTLSDPTAVKPTFTSPNVGSDGESLTFQLTVIDSGDLQSTDTCIVNVTWQNIPPTANAGSDQTVEEGVTVTLDGASSTDIDDGIASYLWEQIGGPPVTLSDTAAVGPTFVTPPVDPSGVTLTFQVTVMDNGGLQATDEVSITINDNCITDFPDDVVTMTCTTGKSIGVKVATGGNCVNIGTTDPATITDTTNRPENLIYGLVDIQLKVNTAGATATVTIYLSTPVPDGYGWYKYSAANGWTDYSANAVFNVTRDQVTLTLVDGGIGDADGVANGLIVDPSGLGTAPASGGDGDGGGGGGGGCFIATAAFGSHIEPHVKILRNFRDTCLLTNKIGQSFVRLYYKYSPPLADFIAGDEIRKTIVRYALYPLVGLSYVALHTTFAQQALIIFGLVAMLSFGFMVIKLRLKR